MAAKKTRKKPQRKAPAKGRGASGASGKAVRSYGHPGAKSKLRPDVGTQHRFRNRKPPQRYHYDSSLSPALNWDGQNPARELGEWLLRCIEKASALKAPHEFSEPCRFHGAGRQMEVRGLQDAVRELKNLGQPFLNWSGRAERLSFDVPTLPLFVHERLSTQAILQTLSGHRRDAAQSDMFGDPQRPIHEQVLRAYAWGKWQNRLVLGDSLVVMNSLLHYEGLGEKVQMIYVDPPYGIRFGANFQPFVRRREVRHNDDEHMSREPETVKAYRDTWELGLHSYLTYMRDRLLLARQLLHRTGSIFVQISDENLHHVREVADDIFGEENFAALICFVKTSGAGAPSDLKRIPSTMDYLLWYARDIEQMKYHPLHLPKEYDDKTADTYKYAELADGTRRPMTHMEKLNPERLPEGSRIFRYSDMNSQGRSRRDDEIPFEFEGKEYRPKSGHWKTNPAGMNRVKENRRFGVVGNTLGYVRYFDDFPVMQATNLWKDTGGGASGKIFSVQTTPKVIQRCILMTTDPGDLVLDPTCGSGTTPFVAEQWGRRWIAVDTSRVPLALARQRLLTATYPYHQLMTPEMGPAGGFRFERKQNRKGREVGGIVPRITLRSIARGERPEEVVLVDRPEQDPNIVRITGPFAVEATIPTPMAAEASQTRAQTEGAAAAPQNTSAAASPSESQALRSFEDRMLEVLRKSPILRLSGGRTVEFYNIRRPARTLSLSAEAAVPKNGGGATRIGAPDPHAQPDEIADRRLRRDQGDAVAILFGPEDGAVSEAQVSDAAKEANLKNYKHLFVIGFAIEPNARAFIENCREVASIPATYVSATPDIVMGPLLKNLRSSQIFSVCGMPDVELQPLPPQNGAPLWQVTLRGLDVFNPVEMELYPQKGEDVPAWFLDTDYNGLCFHACQAFFPRTGAWESLKNALKADFAPSVFDHLSGAQSAPFSPGDHNRIAVKVIDDRGNELMVVKNLEEPK